MASKVGSPADAFSRFSIGYKKTRLISVYGIRVKIEGTSPSWSLKRLTGQPIDALAETLPPEVRLQAEQRGQKRDPLKSIATLQKIFDCDR